MSGDISSQAKSTASAIMDAYGDLETLPSQGSQDNLGQQGDDSSEAREELTRQIQDFAATHRAGLRTFPGSSHTQNGTVLSPITAGLAAPFPTPQVDTSYSPFSSDSVFAKREPPHHSPKRSSKHSSIRSTPNRTPSVDHLHLVEYSSDSADTDGTPYSRSYQRDALGKHVDETVGQHPPNNTPATVAGHEEGANQTDESGSATATVDSVPKEGLQTSKNEKDSDKKKPRSSSSPAWRYVGLAVLLGLVIGLAIAVGILSADHKRLKAQQPRLLDQISKAPASNRTEVIEYLVNSYGEEVDSAMIDKLKKEKEKELEVQRARLNSTSLTEYPGFVTSPSLGIENLFEKINPVYHTDQEVEKVMTDPGLHQTFYSVAYAPRGVIEPECGADPRAILLDIAQLSKVTNRIRTYGTQCNQGEYILEAIKALRVNMTVSLGVWIGDDEYINWKQMDEMKYLLKKYPRELFESVFVGNEVLYREETTAEGLAATINAVKDYTAAIGYADLPVGTSELGSLVNKKVADVCDFVGVNIHPFFAGVNSSSAKDWVLGYFDEQILPLLNEIDSKKVIISEVGWPYQGGSYEEAKADPVALKEFLDAWICFVPIKQYKSIYFEAYDEPWKSLFNEEGRTWETEWGIFDSNRNLKKGVSLPKCWGAHT